MKQVQVRARTRTSRREDDEPERDYGDPAVRAAKAAARSAAERSGREK